MNIEESIIEFKKMIERDKDTLRYWKSDTFGHYDEPIKKLEKDVLISETLLTAYEKEKEKNKELSEHADNLLGEKEYYQLEKEIEELKDKCKELIFEKQELTSALLDSTPDDKIKAKIEELKDGTFDAKIVLQSLLEKEGE